MVGGDEAVFERVRPLLTLMGRNIRRVGGHGDGQTVQVVNQIIVALSSARALGLSLPRTVCAQELFNTCAALGGRGWDHSARVRALERLANFETGKTA